MNPDLSIILLVWRDAHFVPACLESLDAAREDLALEIILIANGVTFDASSPTSAARRLDEKCSLRVIHNPTNRGVAPARNQGLRVARGRYLMLLDTDTQIRPGALTTLVRFMDAHPQVGLAGPRLEDAQGKLQFTCRRLPTVWSKLLRRLPTRWAQRALADELLMDWDHQTPRAVDYVIGACQIIRRAAYNKVGALDEQFFYGPEDVDYCLRMWRAGWQVMYVPEAVVMHHEQRLTKRQIVSALTWWHLVGLARYFWKYRYLWTRPINVMHDV